MSFLGFRMSENSEESEDIKPTISSPDDCMESDPIKDVSYPNTVAGDFMLHGSVSGTHANPTQILITTKFSD